MVAAGLLLARLVLAGPRGAPADEFGPTREAFTERINAARVEHGLSRVRLAGLLSRIAQERAETIARAGKAEPEKAAPEDSAAASKAGYEARFLSEVVVQADGDVDTVVDGAADDPAFAEESARGEVRDLGVGVARLDDIPLYVFVFAVSWPDFFEGKTVELANLPAVRAALVARVNRERGKAGLLPVREEPLLDETALRHAQDMLARSYYGHDSPEGTTALDRSKLSGYKPRFIGENIARGQYSAEEVMDGWMGSPIHREHILGNLFTDVGSAVVIGKNRNGYQVLWVQVFGRAKDLVPSPKPRRGRS